MPSKMPKLSRPGTSCSKDRGGIVIKLYTDIELNSSSDNSKSISFTKFGTNYLAEEIVTEVAKELRLGSLSMQLFALVTPDLKIWLPPNKSIPCLAEQTQTFIFRMRYFVPEKNMRSMLQSDCEVFNYLFLQYQDDYLNDITFDENTELDQILGLVIVDMVRYGREYDMELEQLKKVKEKYFLPPYYKTKFRNPWEKFRLSMNLKNPLETEFAYGHSVFDLKIRYIYDGLLNCAPKYGREMFKDNQICIDPREAEVVCKKLKHEGSQYEVIAKISDLVDVNVETSRTPCEVTINRKANIPEMVSFESEEAALSFAACLDGYYRLTEDFHHHVCGEVRAEVFTKQVKKLRCHGPVSLDWAAMRLRERHQAQPELNFLLKMKHDRIGSYALTCISKGSIISVAVLLLECGRYQVSLDNEPLFENMFELLDHYRKGDHDKLHLQKAVPVSQPMDPLLLLCRNQDRDSMRQPAAPAQQRSAVSLVSSVELVESINTGKYTRVMKGKLLKGNKYALVAVKALKDDAPPGALQALCNALHKVSFWSHPAIVSVHALCLDVPLRGLLDYAPYGTLEQYLQNNNRLTKYDLFMATEQISSALSYLQEDRAGADGIGEVHGNLRCRNILVMDYNNHESILVKIADPGLVYMYNQLLQEDEDNRERMPWVAPECYTRLIHANAYSDRYSLGMTIQEIFTKGDRPFPRNWTSSRVMEHVRNNKPLPKLRLEDMDRVEDVIKACRDPVPENRLKPKEVIREVRSALLSFPIGGGYYSEILWKDMAFTHDLPPRAAEGGRELPPTPNAENVIPPHLIHHGDFKNSLGEGHFGQVYKAIFYRNGEAIPVALKAIKADMYQENQKEFERESQIMISLRHKNIVEIIGTSYAEQHPILIVMEFASHGSLNFYVKKNRPSLETLIVFSKEVAEGMVFLSGKKVVHRDLAARNVLVFDGPSVKISDFGMARFLQEKDYYKTDGCNDIPLFWCAPEVISHKKCGTKGDVWSFGVTLWEMFSYGEKPTLGKDLQELYRKLLDGHRLRRTDNCPANIFAIMIKCWAFEADKRIDFIEVKRLIDCICEEKHISVPP